MEFDIKGSGEYSHLRVELNAFSNHSLDNLQDDLEEFEESLDKQTLNPTSAAKYYREKRPGTA